MASAPGKPSALHPKLGMTWKRALKIEKIARLSLDPANYSNEQIANHLGCTAQTIVLIRQLPEYHAKMVELNTGLCSSYDQRLRQDTDNARDELRAMIPSSMMVIRNALLSKNENIRMKAALEVFDREGSMAKVSKSSVAVEVKPNLGVDANVASNLMALLSTAPRAASDGQVIAGGFTINAASALAQQQGMSEANTEATLESLDLSTAKPN